MRSFSLSRYFALASLGAIAVFAVASAWIYTRFVEEGLADEAAFYGEDICASLNRAIFQEFILPREARGEALDLESPEQLQALDAVVANRVRDLRILTVNLFDRSGTIVYSTNPTYIGYRSMDNPGLEAALRGEFASVLKRAELEQHPIRPGHDLFETYGPFYELDPDSDRKGEMIGAIEIYQDARRMTAEIAEERERILASTIGSLTVLFLALFAIVRRGDLRITQLTGELERSNRELEDRVRARTREIERARERLESLFNGITDGISVIDEDFRVTELNSGIERLFGIEEDTGGGFHCFERYAGRSATCPDCPARATMASGAKAERRYHWPAPEGRAREVEVTTFPFTTSDHRPAVIEVVRDVSERAELERQVVQSESLASLGQMAAGVAHEIRNPIGMITSSAQLLGQTHQLSPRDRELLGVIQKESARVNDTISEFVGFASPPKPSCRPTDPAMLLERARTMLRPEAEQRGIRLEVNAEPGIAKIFVDPELLYRALSNLVLNALQVQGEGGWVGLQVIRAASGEVQLQVSDRGPGVAEEDLERIFQPFFTKRPGGTGLGLSIVQRTVGANGGRVAVSSGPAGTTFTLSFPEADA